MRVGLDFDNTVICYDDLFFAIARQRGLIGPGIPPNKREVRDALRAQSDGELSWQRLQAEVYGPRIGEADPLPGLAAFLETGIERGVRFFVVSHKSRFAAQDSDQRHDLIEAARGWLISRDIVGPDGPVLPQDTYFEPTRREKIMRVGALACDVFIDDLEETFAETEFPAATRLILIDPHALAGSLPNVSVCRSWSDIGERLFGDDA